MTRDDDGVPGNPPPFPGFHVTRSERIYASRWCGLRRDWLRLPDGREQEYHVVEIPDAAAVVPVTEAGAIVLIGQYRYPHGKTHWEVPAGRVSAGETPQDCARREVREETGYLPAKLVPLPGFYAANGISAHWAHLFVGQGCAKVGEPELDDCERLIVREFSRGEVEKLLDAGRFEDGFTALALAYWLRLQRSA